MELENIFYKQDWEDLKKAGFEPVGKVGMIFSGRELREKRDFSPYIEQTIKSGNNNGVLYKDVVVYPLRNEDERTGKTRQYFYVVVALQRTAKTL